MSHKISNQEIPEYYRTAYLHFISLFDQKTKNLNYSKKVQYWGEENGNPALKQIIGNERDSLEENNYYENEYQDLMYNQNPNEGSYTLLYLRRDDNHFRNKFKTEICHNWEMEGECKYGDSCAFAHGESELKKKNWGFNYKTKACKQFFEQGYCSYGGRCQFSHKKEDYIREKKERQEEDDNKVSYLKIIKEFLSNKNKISYELVKRPRLKTFEKITRSTLEERKNSKLKLYEDIMSIKNCYSNNLEFKLSEDSNYTNVSTCINSEKNICDRLFN